MRPLASYACSAALAVSCLVGLSGCRGETSRETPIVPIRNMYFQARYNMQNESEFFEDRRTMRAPVEGAVAREEEVDPRVARGRTEDDSAYVAVIPNEMIARHGGMEPLVKRGQDRFNIYCTPCHDKTGAGDGMIVKHGMLKPPSFHQDRLRHAPDGQIFATISNGVRNMPAYGPQLPVDDRWAITAYVRALQLSQAPIAAETKP
ncbi:c-type cytochrome [Pendulispora albinea]|uniref:Cytochrome c n=1 Tax=Pendulispora albinea TaxID=2741071 RepID=A0ABZ2LQ73_9BACT